MSYTKHGSSSSSLHTPVQQSQYSAMSTKDWASNFWITLVDEEGETFFANPATGERRWQLDPGKLVLPRSLEGEWYEVWSDEHGLPYYFHTRTNETSWYKPEGFIIPLKAVQRSSAGKRFSLSLEHGSSVEPQAPIASPARNGSETQDPGKKPLPTLPASDSFEELARRSLEGENDPLSAAMLQCMQNLSRPAFGLSSSLPAATRTRKSSGAKAVNAAKDSTGQMTRSMLSENSYRTAADVNIDEKSSTSDGSLSDAATSPCSSMLNSPAVQQDGFPPAMPAASNETVTLSSKEDVPPFQNLNDAYDGISPEIDSAVAPIDVTLVSLYPPVSVASAVPRVSPLRLKKRSKITLGEPWNPTVPTAEKDTSKPQQRPSVLSSVLGKIGSSPKSPLSPPQPASPVGAVASCFGAGGSSVSLPDVSEKSDRAKRERKVSRSPVTPKEAKSPRGFGDILRPSAEPKRPRHSSNAPTAAISSPKLSSNAPVQNIAPKRQSQLPSNLLADIKRFSLDQYANEHFAHRKKNVLLRRQAGVSHEMRWQATDLESPILNMDKQYRWDAQQCFTHLQYIMGDRQRPTATNRISQEDAASPSAWDGTTTEEARKLLSLGIANSELRDEIFVQLICQLTDNPSAISIYRGWQFMQVLLVTFPPSPSLEPTLRRFLLERKGNAPKTRLGIIARYALMKLDKIVIRGPKGKPPSLFEIAAASEGAFQPSVFGETLGRIMSLQSEAYPDSKIPIILSFLTDGILALGGLRTPGIFRVPGDVERVNELKITIDQGRYSLFGYEDPHIAASLFKLWLRDLADPLIPPSCYDRCLEAASDASMAVEIIQTLPSLTRRIVAFVVSFLQIFVQDSVVKETMITASSLAMIFTPSFFRCQGGSISTVFNNARLEQKFVLQLLQFLDVSRLQDEDDWVPSHGKSYSGGSSASASSVRTSETSPSLSSSTGPSAGSADTSVQDPVLRTSLDSHSSSSSVFSYASIASSKRKPRRRIQTTAILPAPISADTTLDSEASSVLPNSSISEQDTSRDSMDSVYSAESGRTQLSLRSRTRSDSYLVGKGKNALLGKKVEQQCPPPVPKFIKPRIVIEEAD